MELSGPLATGEAIEGGLGWLATNVPTTNFQPIERRLSYLLLQTRKPTDPIRMSEVDCFARALCCDREQISVLDLLAQPPTSVDLDRADLVLLGGSGDYSVTDEDVWLDRALDTLRRIADRGRPTFASCWGFQAMARALGGRVVHDPQRAELGTIEFELTPEGRQDPVFGSLGDTFLAQAGHEDYVEWLPPDTVGLASTRRVPHQAYRLKERPIYCTQFHPELARDDLLARLRTYPSYIQYIAGVSIEQFAAQLAETPAANALLRRMVQTFFREA